MSDVVLYEVDGGIATITLNRPESLNALNQEISHAFTDALTGAAEDTAVRVVLVAAAGKGFSSGADLADVETKMDAGERFVPSDILRDRYHRFVHAIVEMEKPVIAAVNGVAAGAGASIALACDFRIASDKARFFQAFIKIGLIPDSGANYFLPHLVGYAKALELAMLGDIIDAQTALEIGLVHRVVPHDDLMKEARAFAEQFASGPTHAYGLTKKSLRYGATHGLAETLEYEADLQDQAALTRDATEGIKAFREKRAPNFEGR